MKQMAILVGESDMVDEVASVLIDKVGANYFSVYGPMEEILSEVFKTPITKAVNREFPVTINETHLHKFFGKKGRGIHAVGHFVGKVLASTYEILDYFVKRVGTHCWGPDFLYTEAAERFSDNVNGLYLVVDLNLEEAKKMKSLLQNQCSVVQITKPDEAHEEGTSFFAFDPSEKSWKKSVAKMFESFIVVKKESKNGKQRNA